MRTNVHVSSDQEMETKRISLTTRKDVKCRSATQLYVIEPQQTLWVQVSQVSKTLQSCI